MHPFQSAAPTLLALFWLLLASAAWAQEDGPEVTPLEPIDRQYMQQQRDSIDALSRARFGTPLSGNRDRDLNLLQRLLDSGAVTANQKSELQAMGVVLGDLLAAELDLHWVVYEDRYGRSRALRFKNTDEYLFPVTMISRRREAGNNKRVDEIYRKARDIMLEARPALPFQ